MSRAYRRFLVELQAQWPAKKDGFDLRGIRRLRGAERDSARELLRAAVLDGDSTAVEPLVVLDGESGRDFLRAQLHDGVGETVRARIVAVLLAAGPDPVAEQAVAALSQSRSPHVRGTALYALDGLPASRARLDLATRSLREDPDNRLTAAILVLHMVGRSPGDGRAPDFRVAAGALRSADATTREQMLDRLGVGRGPSA